MSKLIKCVLIITSLIGFQAYANQLFPGDGIVTLTMHDNVLYAGTTGINYTGAVYKYDSVNNTWASLDAPNNISVNFLTFLGNDLYIGSDFGRIFVNHNGQWSDKSLIDKKFISGLFAVESSLYTAVEYESTISVYSTTNASNLWNKVSTTNVPNHGFMGSANASDLFFAGSSFDNQNYVGDVLVFNPSNLLWTSYSFAGFAIRNITSSNSIECIVSLDSNYHDNIVWISANNGASWHKIGQPLYDPSSPMHPAVAISSDDKFVYLTQADGSVWKTSVDTQAGWTQVGKTPATDGSPSSLIIVSDNNIIMATDNGQIWKYNGVSWQQI